jgi:hypothetical protein
MKKSLEEASHLIKADKVLAEFTVTLDGDELHLVKGDESFARLIPVDQNGQWRVEYFHNQKRWELIDFTGTLAACLELLAESPHYLYWDR